MLKGKYRDFFRRIKTTIPTERLITDPLRTIAYGSDASFYRLIPKIVINVENELEVQRILREAGTLELPVTFRAAGTSLSGQAITDSILVRMGMGWNGFSVFDNAGKIRLQPGMIGGHANRILAEFDRKIGPDPASIDSAKIGGILANNASGMCCGVEQNSYRTLDSMRIILADGTVVDTADDKSRAAFRRSHGSLLDGLSRIARPGTGRWGTGRAHPLQVQDQEHHRLQPQCPGRFQRPLRHHAAPDDRLGGDARFHRRGRLPDRDRASPQGQRPDVLSGHPHRLRGDDHPEATAGGRR